MKLVFIHGRGQASKDEKTLKAHWTKILSDELKSMADPLPADLTIEFPYYGDVLEGLVQRIRGQSDQATARGGVKKCRPPSPFEEAFAEEIAERFPASQKRMAKVRSAKKNARGAGRRSLLAVLRALDLKPYVSQKVVRYIRDVEAYITLPAVQMAVDQIVEKAIGGEECVVVSHSLGTVVAYNVLRQRKLRARIARFITLGSPLGINCVLTRLQTPLTMPPLVDHWFNAYDREDIVSLNGLDETNYGGVRPPIENYNKIQNCTENHHGIDGYLNHRLVARRIYDALGLKLDS